MARCLRVDVHTHILPESWPDLKERFGYGGWVRLDKTGCAAGKARMFRDDGTPFRDVDDTLWSLDRRLADCDAVGVDVHVLSTVPGKRARETVGFTRTRTRARARTHIRTHSYTRALTHARACTHTHIHSRTVSLLLALHARLLQLRSHV